MHSIKEWWRYITRREYMYFSYLDEAGLGSELNAYALRNARAHLFNTGYNVTRKAPGRFTIGYSALFSFSIWGFRVSSSGHVFDCTLLQRKSAGAYIKLNYYVSVTYLLLLIFPVVFALLTIFTMAQPGINDDTAGCVAALIISLLLIPGMATIAAWLRNRILSDMAITFSWEQEKYIANTQKTAGAFTPAAQ